MTSKSTALYITVLVLFITHIASAQQTVRGYVYDLETSEPLIGAEIIAKGTNLGIVTNSLGQFMLEIPTSVNEIEVRYIGYETTKVNELSTSLKIALSPSVNALNQVIVSANREKQLRSEVPSAISTISAKQMEETSPNTLDQVLNKIPGVFVADLANEQHMTSIRQPISTKGLFLFLEDGLPTRPTGVFNHNAMNEFNQGVIRSIEVIRGPASSTYGAEAIGGVINIITQSPSLAPTARIAIRANSNGLKRTDFRGGNTFNKTGIAIGGYYAQRRDGFFDHSEMDKFAGSLKVTHALSGKTDLNFSLTYANLDTDMTGSLDSISFFNGDVTSTQTFTERTVSALRIQSTINHDWNEMANTTGRIFFRNNSIGQIPSYRIRTDRNSGITSGTINERTFNSYGGIIQHSQKIPVLKAKLIGGVTLDYSPTNYYEDYILVMQDVHGINVGFTKLDSALTKNEIELVNFGSYLNFQISPVAPIKLSASLRYDHFQYDHLNFLTPSSFSGSPNAKSTFRAVTPKIGVTYDLGQNAGVYSHYAQGFVPPQVGELYNGVLVPELDPSVYNNLEIGGWYSFKMGETINGNATVSCYNVGATNQIISVQLDDGTRENRNAGETLSKGIEYMVQLNFKKQLQFRWSGSFARHEFVEYTENGVVFNGNQLAQGANVQYNWEINFTPGFAKNWRMSLENQHLGSYYMDNGNSQKYGGFDLFNFRTGYKLKSMELTLSVLNLSDELWSPRASSSRFGTSYTLGIPRTFQLGLAYNFSKNG